MYVTTTTIAGMRLAAIRHVGPYDQIGRVFRRLHDLVTAAGTAPPRARRRSTTTTR